MTDANFALFQRLDAQPQALSSRAKCAPLTADSDSPDNLRRSTHAGGSSLLALQWWVFVLESVA